ncbi:MAG: lysophospholipid acyltransferase family protein [Telluria sp.]
MFKPAAALRLMFVTCLAWPVALLWLGLHVRHRERLPRKGPAIVAANHNSHLDILALLSLFPLLSIPGVQPAAAADYFFKNAWIKWFALHLVGIVPVIRGGLAHGDPLEACFRALEQGKVLVIFPEGTRGEPEQLADLKAGIWHLAHRFPTVPVIPVFMQGLGKAMPKGSWIPVPLFISVGIGKPLFGTLEKADFLSALRMRLQCLQQKICPTHDIEEEQ